MTSAERVNPTSIEFTIEGIGVLGPGLANWAEAASALRDPQGWQRSAAVLPPPARLPPAERRRAGALVRLSLAVADEACAQGAVDLATLATVFASTTGDGANCDAMCQVLATPDPAVSPTRFTNSVHNAPAGYWHIAVQSRAPSTSLGAHQASFGAALLEAVSTCVARRQPVLLVCADVPHPEPLHAAFALPDAFGVALRLAPRGGASSLATCRLALVDAAPSRCADAAFETLRTAVPAARALPLLEALALLGATGTAPTSLVLDLFDGCALSLELQRPAH